jgi:hypothetical protein
MPEQQSQGAQAVTAAPVTQPFETAIIPFGAGGLNLRDTLDAIPVGQYAQLTNLIHTVSRDMEARPGLTALATAGTDHHSVRRLSDPQNSTFTRVWGIDQSLYIGQSGALASIDTGYSGAPLYLLPHRPPLSGDPWMFVGDISRMRKVRADGLDLPIGLPAPGAAASPTLGPEQFTPIAGFGTSFFGDDGTSASHWTGNAGTDFSVPPNPTAAPTTIPQGEFVINPGGTICTAQQEFFCYWGLARSLDLSQVGSLVASDDDAMHLLMRLSHPNLTAEVRLYLVCSPNFDPTVLPGTDQPGRSTDFYMKAFRPDDFSAVVQATASTFTNSENARIQTLRTKAILDSAKDGGYSLNVIRADDSFQATDDPTRAQSVSAGGSVAAFKEFGSIGISLRRGDFRRYGTTANCDWSTITGLVIYYQGLPGAACGATSVAFGDWKLTGGYGPDTMEPGAQSYDYRFTHYDPRTGAEGNPSPEMTEATFIDAVRAEILVGTGAYGDAAVRQRVYRRGGSNISDWFFCGVNASDGGVFTDTLSDDEISTAGTVNLDHYEPVPTVNDAGTTVLAQPVPVIFGPANGLLFGLGDPYRPGHLYWCIPDQPDHWPAESNFEVCAPSEELMGGGMHGAQPFCFSRERLYLIYPNLGSEQEVTVTTSGCKRGIVSRWAFVVGLGGIFGVSKDAIFVTAGGAEEVISQDIQGLFRGETVNGYAPIDFTVNTNCRGIRLEIHQDQLFFLYPGTDGCRYVLVYSLLYKFWVSWQFGPTPSNLATDLDTPIANLLVGGLTSGKSYLLDSAAYSDDGAAITCVARTGTLDLGRPREDKLLGDQIVDADPQGASLVLQNRLDNETIINAAQAFAVTTGRQRFVFDSFGTVPQRARNISTEISWSSSTARPVLYLLGQSVIPEPDVTVDRVTQWDDLGHPDEKYLTGISLDVETYGAAKTVLVERDYNGATDTVATLTITSSGRHKFWNTWAGTPVNKIRLRPTDSHPWILYKAEWIQVNEPPRIAGWDIHFENASDSYYSGLDLYCDTGGAEKRIVVTVDNVQLTNTLAGLSYWPVTTNGRQLVHLTFMPPGRGHVFHFSASDSHPGILYSHAWHLDPEPVEQSNWLMNFSIYGSRADKWLKSVTFECDTFGANKQVEIQADGVTVETLTVNSNGRGVVQLALAQQRLGRVWRMLPVDGNPGRLYSAQPVFDEEPFCLTRFETQETDADIAGFHLPLDAQITLKSSVDVTLTVYTYVSQDGLIITDTYVIPSTNGVKDKRYVPFNARKCVLHKFLFSAPTAFWLYKEESSVQILPWAADQPILTHPFGNSGSDRTREMTISALAAARTGGGSA